MASAAAPPLPPQPPGSVGAGPATGTPPAAPPTPAPAMQQGTQLVIGIVNQLRALARAYPGAAPKVAQINDLMREVQAEIMKNQQPGEPEAGIGG